MEQLTIFDVMGNFDESFGTIHRLAEFRFCNVLVLIPKDILCPIEMRLNFRDKDWEERKNKWAGYVWAIDSYKRSGWLNACNLLKEYRDTQKPIPLRVYLNHEFRPDHVVEYLD